MARGKSINLFLMDGDADGRVKCTLANWTGVVYKIPRTDLDKCKERKDLKQSGVYFLFGIDDHTDRPVVYIGQAGARKNGEGLLNRLSEHRRNSEKDYWKDAVAITTSNNSFGPTEISYLENYFYNLALKVGRYEVKNGNDPTPGNITEEKESELQEFIDYTKLIIGTLGYKVFTPLVPTHHDVEQKTDQSDGDALVYLKRTIKNIGLTVTAAGKQTAEGFVVLKGSIISPDENSKNISSGIRKRRQTAKIENNILQEDVLFDSPSGAADFVVGNSLNGWTEWKSEDGRTLRELENSKV